MPRCPSERRPPPVHVQPADLREPHLVYNERRIVFDAEREERLVAVGAQRDLHGDGDIQLPALVRPLFGKAYTGVVPRRRYLAGRGGAVCKLPQPLLVIGHDEAVERTAARIVYICNASLPVGKGEYAPVSVTSSISKKAFFRIVFSLSYCFIRLLQNMRRGGLYSKSPPKRAFRTVPDRLTCGDF